MSDENFLWGFAYILILTTVTAVGYLYAVEQRKRPPWWLLALWAVFAVPLLFKAWVVVVLS